MVFIFTSAPITILLLINVGYICNKEKGGEKITLKNPQFIEHLLCARFILDTKVSEARPLPARSSQPVWEMVATSHAKFPCHSCTQGHRGESISS